MHLYSSHFELHIIYQESYIFLGEFFYILVAYSGSKRNSEVKLYLAQQMDFVTIFTKSLNPPLLLARLESFNIILVLESLHHKYDYF